MIGTTKVRKATTGCTCGSTHTIGIQVVTDWDAKGSFPTGGLVRCLGCGRKYAIVEGRAMDVPWLQEGATASTPPARMDKETLDDLKRRAQDFATNGDMRWSNGPRG